MDLQRLHERIAELTGKFNDVGVLGRALTDRRPSFFADIGGLLQDLQITRSTLEGKRFAVSLVPFIKDEFTGLRGMIDELQQKLASATEKVNEERDAQLGEDQSTYQKRMFDKGAIGAVIRSMTLYEQAQKARTQQVRRAIIDLAGKETDSFERLARSAASRPHRHAVAGIRAHRGTGRYGIAKESDAGASCQHR